MQESSELWVQPLGPEDIVEEGMATHSGILAWSIPGAAESGGLQSIGLPRVRHDWNDLACTHKHLRIWYPQENQSPARHNRYWRRTKVMKSDTSAYPFFKSDSDKYHEKKLGVRE